MKIHILTENSCPNSRAFNCPLLASKKVFEKHGVKIAFKFNHTDSKLLECDALWVNSKYFRYFWQKKKDELFRLFDQVKRRNVTFFWFDTTDSTWCTQFEALPYVDLFFKSQILKDVKSYLKPFRTGRVFTDYFDERYGTNEPDENYPVPEERDLSKIKISWNTCFENYTEKRYGILSKIKQELRPFTANFMNENLKIAFTAPRKNRHIKLSCRAGLGHSRPSIVEHRRRISEHSRKYGAETAKISLSAYFEELRNSQIGIGPFGVGEITLRDFEIIICGAALVKPKVEHMSTWPELFQPNETYVPIEWDLSDFDEKVENLLQNDDFRLKIAENGQKVYQNAVSQEGMDVFVERLLKHVESVSS